MNQEELYALHVKAKDEMNLAGIKNNLASIDAKRARKRELQASVDEYEQLELDIRELRKTTENLARAMTFRNASTGYPELTPIPIKEELKLIYSSHVNLPSNRYLKSDEFKADLAATKKSAEVRSMFKPAEYKDN